LTPQPIPAPASSGNIATPNLGALIANAQAVAAATPQKIEPYPDDAKKSSEPATTKPVTPLPAEASNKPKRRRVRGGRRRKPASAPLDNLPTEPNLPPPPTFVDSDDHTLNIR
jgi:hypothetical protein